MSQKAKDPEDAMRAALDRCITDTIIKAGSCVLLGALTSLVLFKRRRWPLIAGLGMGTGIGVANCEYELNSIFKSKAT